LIACVLPEKTQKVKALVKTSAKQEETVDSNYDAKGNPVWGKKFTVEFKKPEANTTIASIYVMIYTEKGSVIKSKTSLGEVWIEWDECLKWPGEWLS